MTNIKITFSLQLLKNGVCGRTWCSLGVITGGVWAALGAVSWETYARFCGDINAVGAAAGFVGSMFGGVIGETLLGTYW